MTPSEIIDLFTNNGRYPLTKDRAIACIEHALKVPIIQREYFAPSSIIDACNEVFNGNAMTLNRKRENVISRHCAMLVMRNHTFLSKSAIGKVFNNQDHTTVIHGLQTFRNLMETEAIYIELYQKVIHLLGGSEYDPLHAVTLKTEQSQAV